MSIDKKIELKFEREGLKENKIRLGTASWDRLW
jgi:hypothetical protein